MKSLERKIALGFGTALFVLLLVTAAAWWNVARFQGTQYWVERSRETLSHLEQAQSDVLAMQASTRGFVLTGNDEVLQPFQAGTAHFDEALRGIRRLTVGNLFQQERLEQLVPIAEHARQLMLERIAARRARGLDAASETSAYLEGQRTVESFRHIIREMADDEHRLLDERLARHSAFSHVTIVAMITASVLAAGFGAISAHLVRRDLRRRRETEAALQESFARIEDLYHHAPCGYHSLDRTGTFVAINDTALAWLGYTRDEVVGRMNYADILTPASVTRFAERFAHFMREGSVRNAEYEWLRKDGTEFPVLLNASAIYDAAGNYVASRATVFDVTERKRAEQERDRFFTLSRDLLCIANLEGTFKRVNPAWEQILGFTSDELVTRPFLEFVHPEDQARTAAESAQLAAGEESVGFENRYRCKDGSYRWLRWSARAALSDKLIYASARDVTETKAADERIRWLNADLEVRALQLEAANRELESFSYSVSHDLRAPLRHIDGFANLLTKRAAESLDAEGRRYIATISKSAKQMGALIDDLLAFSRIGRSPLQQEDVAHDALVADIIAEGRYESGGAKIIWAIGRLPPVRADAAMLRQVWSNLIDNAVKYSGKVAEPRITIGGRADPAGGECVFFVRDNGVGFDMAYADKLFGVFQRLHGPTEFEGTGIGLANVRRIVTRHGGRTWAEGRVDEGATFFFTLPIHLSQS